MYKTQNVKRRLCCFSALAGTVLSMGLAGCDNCEKNQKNMNTELENIVAEKRRNCNAITNQQARAECHRGVDNYEACVRSCIARWKAACDLNDQEEMEAIKKECYTGPTPCDENWSPTVHVNGIVANFWTPFDEGDSITLALEPRHIIVVDQLQNNDRPRRNQSSNARKPSRNHALVGSCSIETSVATISASAAGRIAWQPSDAMLSEEGARAYTPTEATLTLSTLAGDLSLELLDYDKNEIRIGADGSGTFKALLSADFNGPIAHAMVHPVLWVEIPVEEDDRGISFVANEISCSQFAPVAPNAWADWRRDLVVNLEDYEGFFADFALGQADANGDGVTDDRDAELFLEFFYEEVGG